MRKTQTTWFSEWNEKETAELQHGSELRKGKRKIKRPLDSKKSHHVVMRSSKARGQYNFLTARNRLIVDSVIKKQAARYGIRIERFANVGNHFHFMLRFRYRTCFQNFVRTIAALIARAITGARKGSPFGRFWDALVFTRVITTSYEAQILRSYIRGNIIEAKYGKDIRSEFLLLEAQRRRRRWKDRIIS